MWKDHGGLVGGLGIVQHGEVVDRAGRLYGVVGKGHVLGGQGLPVGEGHVVPDGHRPGEAVLADGVSGGQVIADGQVRVGDGEGGLDERLVDVLPGAPAEGGVKAGGRFGVGVHGDDHLSVPGRAAGGGGAGGIPPRSRQNREPGGGTERKCLHARFMRVSHTSPVRCWLGGPLSQNLSDTCWIGDAVFPGQGRHVVILGLAVGDAVAPAQFETDRPPLGLRPRPHRGSGSTSRTAGRAGRWWWSRARTCRASLLLPLRGAQDGEHMAGTALSSWCREWCTRPAPPPPAGGRRQRTGPPGVMSSMLHTSSRISPLASSARLPQEGPDAVGLFKLLGADAVRPRPGQS